MRTFLLVLVVRVPGEHGLSRYSDLIAAVDGGLRQRDDGRGRSWKEMEREREGDQE